MLTTETKLPDTCGPFTAPNGHTEVIHVVKPGASACVCMKHITKHRAEPRSSGKGDGNG